MGDMPARTPGPWSVGDATGRMVVREVPDMCDGGDYYSVAVTTAHSLLPEGEALANTAFIVEACNQHEALKRRADLVEPLVEALRIIAGQQQCIDNLMGNADVACAALSSWEAAQ